MFKSISSKLLISIAASAFLLSACDKSDDEAGKAVFARGCAARSTCIGRVLLVGLLARHVHVPGPGEVDERRGGSVGPGRKGSA